MAQVKEMFNESGFFETANKLQQQLEENRKVSGGRATAKETVVEVRDSITNKDRGQSHTENRDRITPAVRGKKSKIPVLIRSSISQSDVTIYDTAVKDATKRISSSSEEEVDPEHDTSDEVGEDSNYINKDTLIDNFIADQRIQFENQTVEDKELIASTSGAQPRGDTRNVVSRQQRKEVPQADLIADDMIKQAELGRARIYETPGELQFSDELRGVTHKIPHMTLDLNSEYVHSVMVDENYLVLGSHIDDGTKQKIAKGEYVDFAKLLPKDRILTLEEPQRLEMMTKNMGMFFGCRLVTIQK